MASLVCLKEYCGRRAPGKWQCFTQLSLSIPSMSLSLTTPFKNFFAFFRPEILVEVPVGRAQTGGGGGESWRNLGAICVHVLLSLSHHCVPGLVLSSARLRAKQSSSGFPVVGISIAGGPCSRQLTRTFLYFQRDWINGTPGTALDGRLVCKMTR